MSSGGADPFIGTSSSRDSSRDSSSMGVAASSFKGRPKLDDDMASSSSEIWITLKAKTTCKRTRAVKKNKLSFQPTTTGVTIGVDPACDMVLEDASLAPTHAIVEVTPEGGIHLRTIGRTYYLIGQGIKTTGPHTLLADQVVKMGACSMQITHTCTTPRDPAQDAEALKKFAERSEDSACYICFDDSSETGNELVPSPCLCSKPVHRMCLSRWISTKGSRLCSICKAKLPIDCTVSAPYLILQVVRHMRGLHWAGEREYIISFDQRPTNSIVVGSGADCDLSLPDPSLSRSHSRISFADGKFIVEDLTSSAGTFLKIASTHPLALDQPAMFKIGRTMLTIKIERRKAGVLRSWRRKKQVGSAVAGAGAGAAAGIGAGGGPDGDADPEIDPDADGDFLDSPTAGIGALPVSTPTAAALAGILSPTSTASPTGGMDSQRTFAMSPAHAASGVGSDAAAGGGGGSGSGGGGTERMNTVGGGGRVGGGGTGEGGSRWWPDDDPARADDSGGLFEYDIDDGASGDRSTLRSELAVGRIGGGLDADGPGAGRPPSPEGGADGGVRSVVVGSNSPDNSGARFVSPALARLSLEEADGGMDEPVSPTAQLRGMTRPAPVNTGSAASGSLGRGLPSPLSAGRSGVAHTSPVASARSRLDSAGSASSP